MDGTLDGIGTPAPDTLLAAAAGAAPAAGKRADFGSIRLTGRDVTALLWCGEMYGIRSDLLADLLGTSGDVVRRLHLRWRRAALAETGRLGPGPSWCWLTRTGLDACGLGYDAKQPALGRLRHVHATARVRLALGRWAPYRDGGAWWRSERHLRWRIGGGVGRRGHVPDGEMLWPATAASFAGQVWAVEVELTAKTENRTASIMTELLNRTADYGDELASEPRMACAVCAGRGGGATGRVAGRGGVSGGLGGAGGGVGDLAGAHGRYDLAPARAVSPPAPVFSLPGVDALRRSNPLGFTRRRLRLRAAFQVDPEAVTTAVLTATLVPFVQAIAAQAGQDVYAAIRRLLSRDKRQDLDGDPQQRRLFRLVEQSSGTAILVPRRLPGSAARQLAAMRMSDPAIAGAELLWDPGRERWLAYPGAGDTRNEPLLWDGHAWRPLPGRGRVSRGHRAEPSA